MQHYKGAGLPIEAIKAAATSGNQNAARTLNSFLVNCRHTVQIGFITLMLLAVGRADYPYDQEGNINQKLAAEAFDQFSRAYTPQASEFIRPLVLGRFDAPNYPTFTEIRSDIKPVTMRVVVPPQDYASNLRIFSTPSTGQPQQMPQVPQPPQQPQFSPQFQQWQQSTDKQHYFVQRVGYAPDGKTPTLDRFRVTAVGRGFEKIGGETEWRDGERGYLEGIDRDIEELRRVRRIKDQGSWPERRILDPYAQPWPVSDAEARFMKDRLQRNKGFTQN